MRIDTILALACGLSLAACSLYFEQDPGTPPPPSTCELRSGNEAVPGYPYDFAYYQQVVWPLTQRGCGLAGCHDAQDGFSASFEVWPQDGDPCSPIRSFNALYDHSDYTDWPEASFVLRALDGSLPTHPVQPGPGSVDYVILYGFIQDAWFESGNAPSQSIYFDFDVFQSEIQPLLDIASCAAVGCHDEYTVSGGFSLYPEPPWSSLEMFANLEMVASFVDFNGLPEQTRLYNAAIDWHGGTAVYDPPVLLDWIADAFSELGAGPLVPAGRVE
jgi:hypothetical protein